MTDLTAGQSKQPGKPGNVTASDGHTYHKSATANATEAPTSGSTKSAAESTAESNTGLSEEEIDFITVIDMHWGVHGELLTPEQAELVYSIPVDTFNDCWRSDLVKAALNERGISLKKQLPDLAGDAPIIPEWRRVNLTPEQLVTANVMCDLYDTRNDRKKLADLGVTSTRYNAWLRQPEFQKYLQGRAESLVQGALHEAGLALVDKVKSGDIKAIAYLHEYTGKFSLHVNGDGTNGAVTAESVRTLIQSIIEIIVEEVDDSELGDRISQRIGGLITARTTANALVNSLGEEAIRVPEIATGRVITPEIETLMNSGVGSDT